MINEFRRLGSPRAARGGQWAETYLLVELVDIERGLVLGLDEDRVLLDLSGHFV